MFQKVKFHNFIKRYLPIIFSFVVFVFSIPINVKADELGVPLDWDGSIDISYPNPMLYLDESADRYYITNENTGATYVMNRWFTLKSNTNVRLDIKSKTNNVYLNGYLRMRINAKVVPSDSSVMGYLKVNCDPVIMNGIFITVEEVSANSNADIYYDIYVRFDNYFLNGDIISLPLKVNHSLTVYNTTYPDSNFVTNYSIQVSDSTDWAGDVTMYESLDDVPSMDGYFAEQNTEIINQTTINNDLLQQQIQQDHQDTLDQTDSLINGYDNSAGNAAADRLDDTTSDLNNAENSLFGNVSGANEDYTDITDFFTNLKVLESFSFIKSIMESIFSAMGDFAMPITIAFMFVIVTRIIGYQQFTSGGG